MTMRTIVLEENTDSLQVTQTLGYALDIAKKMHSDIKVKFRDGFEMTVTPTSIRLLEDWNILRRAWTEASNEVRKNIQMVEETDIHFVKSDSEMKSSALVPHGPNYTLSAKEARRIACDVSGEKVIRDVSSYIRTAAIDGEFGIELAGHIRSSIQEFFINLGYKVQNTNQNGNDKVKISWK